MPREFRWRGDVLPPYRLVLLDESYEEVAQLDGIVATTCAPSADIAALLATGGTFHWFVEGQRAGRLLRSPLQSLEIR